MDWNITVSCLNIKLGHKCPSAELGHHADDLVNCYVMKGKLMGVDPIIDACTTGGREVHYHTPLPRLTLFGNNPEATYMKVGEGRRSERARNPTPGNLMGQILINDQGLLVG